ncbi:MAG: 3-carboxy-cis,cis-muconate cycloisomerase [Acidimicrobiaceae bacterium]|nr:3-carboxy-cis,cis-muconate cycloisomerase [Acidimicrobiaceae bacterium]
MTSQGGLFESIFTTDAMLQATSDEAWVRAMLHFEGALARASAGIVPAEAAAEIVRTCQSTELDPVELGRAGRVTGNPVMPLVAELRSRLPPSAAGWVHFGATSQDALDTALMVVARSALYLVAEDLRCAAEAAADLASRYRSTPMAARTLLQQALPTTFGAKVAGWLVGILEARDRVRDVQQRCLAVQLGGAAGTLASLRADGPRVIDALAVQLDLAAPVVPWHTDRSRVVEIAAALAQAVGVCGKVATDVALLMQTEVGEVAEPGRGTSSALPHKRNPAISSRVLSSARRVPGLVSTLLAVMAQEHERSAGGWHAEWQTMVELMRAAGGAASGVATVLEGLEVDEDAMARNLARTGGMLLSERATLELARDVGYVEARHTVEDALERSAASGASLPDQLPELPEDVWDPAGWIGSAELFVDRALRRYRP